MKTVVFVLVSLGMGCLLLTPPGGAQVVKIGAAGDNGFVPLFNGKDLAGWHNVNCAPDTFYVKDGMIITTGVPTGYLRTDRQYENFILEFEWYHAPKKKGAVGNSGLFVWGDPIPAMGTGYTRSIEVQVLVNLEWKTDAGESTATSNGDLFSIWGAKCKPDRPHPLKWERSIPSENRAKGEHEWNHYRVVGNNGVLKLSVNGKEVSGVSECKPRKGYLALESEGSECRFKNLKIKELPSTNPKADEVCDVDKGWKALFTGVDLAHWKASDEQKAHWRMNDGVLNHDGKSKKDDVMWSDKAQGNFELVFDWRMSGKGEWAVYLRGSKHEIALKSDKGGKWHRSVLRVKGDRATLRTNDMVVGETQFKDLPASGPLGLASENSVQLRNFFVRELKGDE